MFYMESVDVMVVSNRLKEIMTEQGVSEFSLANSIGISPLSLHMKICGKREWFYWELIAIKKILGVIDAEAVFPELYDCATTVSG